MPFRDRLNIEMSSHAHILPRSSKSRWWRCPSCSRPKVLRTLIVSLHVVTQAHSLLLGDFDKTHRAHQLFFAYLIDNSAYRGVQEDGWQRRDALHINRERVMIAHCLLDAQIKRITCCYKILVLLQRRLHMKCAHIFIFYHSKLLIISTFSVFAKSTSK